MVRISRKPILLIALLTGAYVAGIAFNLSPWLRGPQEWRWAYVIPGSLSRLLPATLPLAAYSLFLLWWLRRPRPRARAWPLLLLAGVMTAVVQLSLLTLEHEDVRSQLFYRTVSPLSGGFFNVGAPVTDNAAFLATFVEQMPGFPVHPQRHPPGLPLLFAWARQLFDLAPGLAAQVSAGLRPYQCHNLALMNLPNSAIAAATLQMALPLALGVVVWPLYLLGRDIYDGPTALRAALWWPLVPSVALWATRWNQLYALFTLLAFIFLHRGLTRRRPAAFLLCGLVLWLATWFSFGNLALVLFLGLYALLWIMTSSSRPALIWLVGAAMLLVAGLALPWLVLGRLAGFDPLALWRGGVGTHLELGRSYVIWLFYHLFDYFVFLGIPLAILCLWRALRVATQWQRSAVDVLALSAFAGLLALNLSGASQGETARVWAFLIPLFMLVSARVASHAPHLGMVTVAFLALQLVVSNIFLRPVGTGLLDPPAAPPATLAGARTSPLAVWREGPILEAAGYPPVAAPGADLQLHATWSTTAPIQRPYSVFVHLVGETPTPLAQHDGLPLNGEWLTTCWRPHERFSDGYRLAIPPQAAPGVYELRLGFYWLPSGERLPLLQPPAPDHSFNIGQLVLK